MLSRKPTLAANNLGPAFIRTFLKARAPVVKTLILDITLSRPSRILLSKKSVASTKMIHLAGVSRKISTIAKAKNALKRAVFSSTYFSDIGHIKLIVLIFIYKTYLLILVD